MKENLNETYNTAEISDYDRMSFEINNSAKKRKKIIIIVLLIIIGIILISIPIILFFYFQNKKENKEKEIICEPGRFNPIDKNMNNLCLECSIKECEKCFGTKMNNTCFSCYSSFFPIYENNTIKRCDEMCKGGEEEKCLTCDEKTNK